MPGWDTNDQNDELKNRFMKHVLPDQNVMLKDDIFFRPKADNNQELLEEINRKLDQILSHMGVPSAYIYNGAEVLDAFKKLKGKE